MAKTRGTTTQQNTGSGVGSLTNPDNLIDVERLKYFEQKLDQKHATATVAETLAALSELT